jgi:8-oxo-dGTP pyrophosphatase MutT (NUDIX family)
MIRAAGGVVWRVGSQGPVLALVHRPRSGEWRLPKGKLEGGESWEEAALREVREETGCEARVVSFAGAVRYSSARGPKLVLFWNMELIRAGGPVDEGEVDDVAWLPPAAAARLVDRARERRIIALASEDVHRVAAGRH